MTPVFFFPLCCESLLQLISDFRLLHNIICLQFEHSTPTHPNPETQQHNINQSFQHMRLVDFNSNTITYVKTLHSLFPVQLELSHVQSQLLLITGQKFPSSDEIAKFVTFVRFWIGKTKHLVDLFQFSKPRTAKMGQYHIIETCTWKPETQHRVEKHQGGFSVPPQFHLHGSR